jgi:hypothetical protein
MTALTWVLQENLRDRRFLDELKRALDELDLAWCAAPLVPTCIDVASSADRFGVLEANCFNASRFYAADTATVLARVSAHVRATLGGRP